MSYSQYVIEGKLSPVDNEGINLTTDDATLTSGKYTKANKVANVVIVTIDTADGVILWTLKDADTSLPTNAAEGVRWAQSDGPLVLHCDPSQFLVRDAADTPAINVNYFTA